MRATVAKKILSELETELFTFVFSSALSEEVVGISNYDAWSWLAVVGEQE